MRSDLALGVERMIGWEIRGLSVDWMGCSGRWARRTRRRRGRVVGLIVRCSAPLIWAAFFAAEIGAAFDACHNRGPAHDLRIIASALQRQPDFDSESALPKHGFAVAVLVRHKGPNNS